MNKEERQWIQAACEFLADAVAECCGLDNAAACSVCTYRRAALDALEEAGDYTPPKDAGHFSDTLPGGDIAVGQ